MLQLSIKNPLCGKSMKWDEKTTKQKGGAVAGWSKLLVRGNKQKPKDPRFAPQAIFKKYLYGIVGSWQGVHSSTPAAEQLDLLLIILAVA